MFISHFNKMIRNRLLWGAFAVIIVIAFVGVFSPDVGSSRRASSGGVGQLYGEDISRGELSMARFFVMGMRDPRGLSEEIQARVSREAWRRLAALKTAQRMGIRTGDEEVARQIQRDPNFAANGRFSPERYKAVVQSQWGFQDSVQAFEEYLRQELTLRKLAALLECAVWVPPAEVSDRIASLTDEFTVDCVLIPAWTNAPAALDDQALLAFYEAHTNLFAEPDRTRVRYVELPVSNYLAGVTVGNAEISDYYTNRMDEYSYTNADGTVAYQGLDEVREAVSNLLASRRAAFEAKDDAVRLVMALTPDRAGRAPGFEEAAAGAGLTVATSAYFAAFETVPGLKVDREFNRAAFRLDASDPEGYFSDAIMGDEAAYVLAALDSVASHVPPFTNVVELVRPLAGRDAAEAAGLKRAGELRETLLADVGAGAAFGKAVADRGLNIATSCTFSAYSADPDAIFHAEILLPEVIALDQGRLTPPLETDDGLLLGYVAERRAPPFGTASLPRGEVLSALNRYRAEILFGDWQQAALEKAGFTEPRQEPETENGTDADGAGS
ncbi:MAG: hypothetical protein FJ225_08760 [Lentisphaerae bacterium]|nr:hypothetical protein [Lentisphaerota bacterium]